jgi:hypothetical protein
MRVSYYETCPGKPMRLMTHEYPQLTCASVISEEARSLVNDFIQSALLGETNFPGEYAMVLGTLVCSWVD